MNTTKILAPFAFAFIAIVTGCSGAAPEGSDIQSSQLKGPADKGGDTKGDDGNGDPSDEGGKEAPPEPTKGEPSDTPDKGDPSDKGDPGKDPGKDVPPSDGTCFVVVEKSSCQSDDDWKNAAAQICDAKGYSLTALSTSGDCKGGSTVAKLECCQ